jgi:hypothetical protein
MGKETENNATDKRERVSLETTLLGSSASMLGFCFTVISYINVSKLADETIIDECTAVAMVAFMTCCFLSFLAMHKVQFQTERYVKIISYIFLSGLLMLFANVVIIATGLADSPGTTPAP